MPNSVIPNKDMIKFKNELDSKFKIISKTKTAIRKEIIFIEINNNDFE